MMSTSDRNRMLVATAVTLVALPTLWISSRDQAGNAGPRVAAIGAPGAPGPASSGSGIAGDQPPAYLEGPTTSPESTTGARGSDAASDTSSDTASDTSGNTPGDTAGNTPGDTSSDVIASASAALTDDILTGTAGFERFSANYPNRACRVPDAPFGSVITVRNLDTDRTTSCLNSSTSPTRTSDIATIDIDVFLEVADLTDAPLPVELTW